MRYSDSIFGHLLKVLSRRWFSALWIVTAAMPTTSRSAAGTICWR